MVIRAYHKYNGQGHRNIVLIPSSAHGTNPASAVMAGSKVIVVKCDENGNIDVNDLKLKAEQHKENLSALMVTYPSTHGVFEESIKEICEIIHQNGGQVYMDGANMNAQVGLTSPAEIGADVCHLNLHKTFAIPHGGGGPGIGPIAVAKHLSKFLPNHVYLNVGGENGITAVSSAPFGSAGILLISYSYIKMLGEEGLTHSTKCAILNANYLKSLVKDYFEFTHDEQSMHEFVMSGDKQKKRGVSTMEMVKRLLDYGFHAPTVYFPLIVHEALLVEPTETETKESLEEFAQALIAIDKEIDENPELVKNAPHTTPVKRINDAYAARNLNVCWKE